MRQRQALAVMMSGANVFLTGAPGAGKTYVLNEFIQRAERAGRKVAVTASTGIAASHLGGMTIHSWSGLGILDRLTADDLRRLGGSDKLAKRYNAADVLVIDEISMLHGSRLDMINKMAKLLRGSDEPFGGLQVILVGDLFQLPPVSRDSREVDFVHMSAAWQELEPKICYITEQHRQSDNDALLVFLEAMRRAEVMEDQFEIITERLNREPDGDAAITRLYTHNIDVDTINDRHLHALPGKLYTFEATAKGSKAKREQLMKSLLVPEVLELKIGAEVMFVANNFALGFVNGSRGQVVDVNNGVPIVRLANGREIRAEPNTWSLNEDGNVVAEISQLPLRLAWAITIHKSQGMSLDAAEIDLAKAFTPGMGYVALSRVRGLDGLYLKGLNNMSFQLHPLIHEFDIQLRDHSAELASITDDIGEEEIPAEPVYELDEKLLEKLKNWRIQKAQANGIPAYMVAHNTALEALATIKPVTPQQLIVVPGFGKMKVEKYGLEIISIIAGHEL
jgi:ATP-dependent exoDNAse (exonuclease V) alpha subunit